MPLPSPADSAFARGVLRDVLIEHWRAALDRRYDLALAVGVRTTLLPDLSSDGRKGDLRLAQRIGGDLDQLNVAALSQPDYVTALALRWDVEASAEASAFFWVDFSFFSPVDTPLRQLTELYRLHPIQGAADADRYLFFVEAFPFILERVRSGLVERRTRGYVAPREMVQSVIGLLTGLRALGENGPWALSDAHMAALDTTDRRALRAEIALSANYRVVPSIDSLIGWLRDDYLPTASARAGLWQYPGGKEFYRHLLRRHTTLDVPPEDAHRVGLAELRRIDSTLAALRRRHGWNPDARAFHDSLRLAAPASPPLAELATRVEAILADAVPALAASFPSRELPAVAVRPATAAEERLWPDGIYLPSTATDSLAALLLTERWRTPGAQVALAARTHRLLIPGMHLQHAWVRGDTTLTAFRRYSSTAGFVDGWGRYAASLAGEAGLYRQPLDAYGALLDDGVSAALLVIDTGIHYLGWTTAQARAVLGRYLLSTESEVDTMVVEHVINEPGRAGAALLGAREVAAMRGWMQREQREAFSLPRWHGEVLSLGALPLPIVGSHLEWWLYETERQRADSVRAARRAASDSTRRKPQPPPSR